MVSVGVRDFLVLLFVIADAKAERKEGFMGLMWGRCPDCLELLSGRDPGELAGDILGHVCLVHSTHEQTT